MENKKVFFQSVQPFPLVNNDLIETKPFLQASKYIVEFVDILGTTFKPIKNDIQGNIDKLFKVFEADPEKFKYLNSIVKMEKQTLKDDDFHIGTDALTWLNRALVYNLLFLSFFLEDYKKSENSILSEDLRNHFNKAYELTLKKHHSWWIQKIFSVCMMAAPSRNNLLEYLGYTDLGLSDNEFKLFIVQSIEEYVLLLKANTEAISILLFTSGYEP